MGFCKKVLRRLLGVQGFVFRDEGVVLIKAVNPELSWACIFFYGESPQCSEVKFQLGTVGTPGTSRGSRNQ